MAVRYQFRENLLLDAASNSEKFIATLRIIIFFVMALIPNFLYFVLQDSRPEIFLSVIFSICVLFIAIGIYLFVSIRPKKSNQAWVIMATDISLVTLLLLLIAVYSNPLLSTNSLFIWQVYGLVIFVTTLRLNYKMTLFAGLLATLQYGLLIVYLDSRWELSSSGLYSESYGAFAWSIQLGRLCIMLLITLVATGFVIRSHRLVIFSGTDSLTGLKNRAYFEHMFSHEINTAIRKKQALSIAFLDMDHFKSINDQHGHAIGDLALQKVADILNTFKHETYKLARWGGEEFVFLFPNTHKIEAIKTVNQIRDELKQGVHLKGGLDLSLQLSAGISECPAESADPLELINLADDRMLQAKRLGRDRVIAS